MLAQVSVSPLTIEELVAQILMYRKITRADLQVLKRALLVAETLNEQERILIERVFYGVRHGLLRVIE